MNRTQCRMAVAALGWSHQRFARVATVPNVALNRYLIGHDISPAEVAKLREALEAAGAKFEDDNEHGTGVRMKHKDTGLRLKAYR